jgi:nicotinate phosphoribosyltransferase
VIIDSLLDTDFYKFTMMQAVLHQFPGATVEYGFKCRTPNIDLTPHAAEIQDEIEKLCQLRFKPDELEYLDSIPFFKKDFIEFLRIFTLNSNFIQITTKNHQFDISIKGPWLHTILFEVPLLAIIGEVYYRHQYPKTDYTEGLRRLTDKITLVKKETSLGEFKFSDFGTRRRFSRLWHEEVLKNLTSTLKESFLGTSNVLFAKRFNLKPIGTMAHEYLQACQSLGPRLIYSQKFALERWAQEYRGELGIALSDVYGIDAFLRDFDLYFCKLFDGARHDSGDPFEWGEKVIEHYTKFGIDARTKMLVFSDQLSIQSALDLFQHFKNRAQITFGIGTSLTNDIGYEPIQIVIKMIECNGQPVAKVSDSPEKTMCRDASYLAYLKQVFKIQD